MRLQTFLGLLLTLLAPLTLQANVVSRSDVEYHSLHDHNYEFIAPADYFPWLHELVSYNQYFKKQYQSSFSWVLDETAALILASEQNQVANGFATVIPTLETVFFPSGAELLDRFAVKSWLYTLLSHETAHLYQLNVKRDLSSASKQVVGNSLLWAPLGFPIFIHPNAFTPTFLIEGNAVMNESRFGLGGRLYSGEYRALFLSQVKSGQLTATRLINDHLDFPFGTEKYIAGGYFNLYLAERFGVDHTNQFFYHQANHYFNPLILKSTFERHYGSDYNLLIHQFSQHFRPLAEKQVSSRQEPFLQAIQVGPMNHDKDKVFFLTSDGTSEPYLNIYDKKNRRLTRRQMDLPNGKLFQLEDGRYYAATAYIVDTTDTKYSLFGESYSLRSEYLSRIVQDIRAGHTLAIDATTSFVEPQLYLDEDFFATAHSSAILDDQGHVYYFKQNGRERQIFKDKEPVAKFSGYYGKLLEVDESQTVYFISATETGSSLFASAYGEVVRLSDSDTIVDARKVGPRQFLVCEVGPEGYSYKIIATKARPQPPHQYRYKFEQEPQIKAFTDSFSDHSSKTYSAHPYSALRSVRYSSMNLGILTNSEGDVFGQAVAYLTDPLQYNNITLGYGRGYYGTHSALVSYANQKHRLGWYLGYSYNESADITTKPDGSFEVRNVKHRDLAFTGLTYPIFHRERLRVEWRGEFGWLNKTDTQSERMGVLNELSLSWGQHYMLGYEPYRLFNLSLAQQTSFQTRPEENQEQTWGFFSNVNYDLGDQNYVSARAGWALSATNSIRLGGSAPLHASPFYISRLLPGTSVEVSETQVLGLGYKKAFDHSYYFSRFPVSLRRWAPFVRADYYAYREKEDAADQKNLTEAIIGAEFELLLAHRFPARITLSGIKGSWAMLLATEAKF